MKLKSTFYTQHDVVSVSKQLLGKVLCTQIAGEYTSGIICETEAYAGVNDKASHAYGGRRTQRTETMYARGGVAYVYLCYGIHYLFNVVTNEEEIPHAVLIRGIQPLEGIDTMLKRRNKTKLTKDICIGPGKLSQSLGISKAQNAIDLLENEIWIEDRKIEVDADLIKTSKRIGIDYAEADALLPYRFEYDF